MIHLIKLMLELRNLFYIKIANKLQINYISLKEKFTIRLKFQQSVVLLDNSILKTNIGIRTNIYQGGGRLGRLGGSRATHNFIYVFFAG